MKTVNLVRRDDLDHYSPPGGGRDAILCTEFVDSQFPEWAQPPEVYLKLSLQPASGLHPVFVDFLNCGVTIDDGNLPLSIFVKLRDMLLQFVRATAGPGTYSGANVYMGLFLGHAEEGAP